MEDPGRALVLQAITQAARDAGLDTPQAMSSSPGYEIPVPTNSPAQGKVILLVAHTGSVHFTVRAYMSREFGKRIYISDYAEWGARRFPVNRILVNWLRHQMALAARDVHRLCEPEHQEKLRRAEVARQKQR